MRSSSNTQRISRLLVACVWKEKYFGCPLEIDWLWFIGRGQTRGENQTWVIKKRLIDKAFGDLLLLVRDNKKNITLLKHHELRLIFITGRKSSWESIRKLLRIKITPLRLVSSCLRMLLIGDKTMNEIIGELRVIIPRTKRLGNFHSLLTGKKHQRTNWEFWSNFLMGDTSYWEFWFVIVV